MAAWRQSAQGESTTSFIIQLILLVCGLSQDAHGQGKILSQQK